MSANITISRGTASELDHVIAHRSGMFRDMGVPASPAFDLAMANSLKFFQKMVAEDRYLFWLARDPEQRVIAGAGLVIYDWTPHPDTPEQFHRALVKNVYVEPEYRRRGIARRLMDEVIAYCRVQGLTQVWLHASNEGRPLYDSMGFKATNEMKLIF
jgi:ribosomal protein S18 acetylase RimI-like enzyme